MIIFYDKTTGDIRGTIDGRIHDESHLRMWVGDREDNARIVVQWKPVRFYDKKGNEVPQNSKKFYTADFEPESEQKELMMDIDSSKENLFIYKVDTETKTLVKK